MALISRSDVKPNDVITASKFNDDFNTIYREFNGRIDRTNLATKFVTTTLSQTIVVTKADLGSIQNKARIPEIQPFAILQAIGLSVTRSSIETNQAVRVFVSTPTWSETLPLFSGWEYVRAIFAPASHAIDPTIHLVTFSVVPMNDEETLLEGQVFCFNLFLLAQIVAANEV